MIKYVFRIWPTKITLLFGIWKRWWDTFTQSKVSFSTWPKSAATLSSFTTSQTTITKLQVTFSVLRSSKLGTGQVLLVCWDFFSLGLWNFGTSSWLQLCWSSLKAIWSFSFLSFLLGSNFFSGNFISSHFHYHIHAAPIFISNSQKKFCRQ